MNFWLRVWNGESLKIGFFSGFFVANSVDKKKALQTEDLMKAISKSSKTFDEIMQFISEG